MVTAWYITNQFAVVVFACNTARLQALGLSRISSLKSYREAVRLQKKQIWHQSPQLFETKLFHCFGAVRLDFFFVLRRFLEHIVPF